MSLFNGMERWNGMEWNGHTPLMQKQCCEQLLLAVHSLVPRPSLDLPAYCVGDQEPEDEAIQCMKIQLDRL